MSDFKFFWLNWIRMWGALVADILAILTFGKIDLCCKVDGIFLDYIEERNFKAKGEDNE